MRYFILDEAEFERQFNEMAKRDFAWAYMPVPKLHFDGVTRVFLSTDSNKKTKTPKD